MSQKKMISLCLEKDDLMVFNKMCSTMGVSRTQIFELLMASFINKIGNKEFTEALEAGNLKEVVEKKMKFHLIGRRAYIYKDA